MLRIHINYLTKYHYISGRSIFFSNFIVLCKIDFQNKLKKNYDIVYADYLLWNRLVSKIQQKLDEKMI